VLKSAQVRGGAREVNGPRKLRDDALTMRRNAGPFESIAAKAAFEKINYSP
jgi:hypothetical protein